MQVLAVLSGWGLKLADVDDRLNVNGSGISLGHPIGATGVRILTTDAARIAPPWWGIGLGDDVHRRRSGHRRTLPGGRPMTYVPPRLCDATCRGIGWPAATSGLRRGDRVVASYDEDSTTMAVAAGARVLHGHSLPTNLYFATSSPAYADKTNASAIHAALGLPYAAFATDLCGTGRSGIAAWRAAAATGGLALTADVRVGRPGSADERLGGDGASALLFGEGPAIADILATTSHTAEFLDRWRSPRSVTGEQWEERFGADRYAALIRTSVDRDPGRKWFSRSRSRRGRVPQQCDRQTRRHVGEGAEVHQHLACRVLRNRRRRHRAGLGARRRRTRRDHPGRLSGRWLRRGPAAHHRRNYRSAASRPRSACSVAGASWCRT